MKGFSVMDEDTLFDLAVEHVTDSAAEKLGFKQGIKQQWNRKYLLGKSMRSLFTNSTDATTI